MQLIVENLPWHGETQNHRLQGSRLSSREELASLASTQMKISVTLLSHETLNVDNHHYVQQQNYVGFRIVWYRVVSIYKDMLRVATCTD